MECHSCHAVGFEQTEDGLCVLCHRIVELEESVRVEKVDFDGERGCRFIVGEDHVVAEWRGDGVAVDTVFVEKPALTYFKTTSPLDRCIRMVLDMVHWEVACAMLAGPGDGKLEEFAVKYRRHFRISRAIDKQEIVAPATDNDRHG